MKKLPLLLAMLIFAWSGLAMAAGTQYELRVDGLSCPFCAYGIEKKLKKTPGVESVEINLERGMVVVKARTGVVLTKAQMKKLVKDAGFSLRSMTEKALP